MTDRTLSDLLERAAGSAPQHPDAQADLRRGHHALSRLRRRRGAVGLAGVAAVAVVGVGTVRYAADDGSRTAVDPQHTKQQAKSAKPSPRQSVQPSATLAPVAAQPVVLVAQQTVVGAFTFDQVPQGWESQGPVNPGDPVADYLGKGLVTFATVGFPDKYPDSFVGKLVVMFDKNGPHGAPQQVDGRTVWVNHQVADGYTLLYVHSRPDEPEGQLTVQYPDDTGWTQPDMIKFLTGIHLGPGAQAMAAS